jgi:formamidopyrimidine-DNA glycosylase
MPELPEVHTITTDLKKHVQGATITSVTVTDEFKVSPESKIFKKMLPGKKISGVRRIAKNIVVELEPKDFLVIHLAMTGQVLFRKVGFKQDRWTRVIFNIEKDGKEGELRYTDMRMFGKVQILDDLNLLEEKYGPDPLDKKLTGPKFLEILQRKRTNIKNALLDQKLIAGIGNIYANDSLWIAKIHPETKTKDLTKPMAKELLEAVREILKESIKHRGSTLSDKMYVDIFGRFGKHQNYLKIYGKEECPRCEIPTIFKKINGRGTFLCNNCQLKDGQEKLI